MPISAVWSHAAGPFARRRDLLGDWRGQPRLVVQASDSEVLRDDALLLAETAADAGVDVRLKVHRGAPHVWNLAYPSTPESVAAVDEMAEQLDELLGPAIRSQ